MEAVSPTTSRSPVRMCGSSAERAAWLGGLASVATKTRARTDQAGMNGIATSTISAIRIRSQSTITWR